MKIVFMEQPAVEGNNPGKLTFDIQTDIACRMRADSTLLRGGKPFFVPTFTADCRLRAGLVVRISRLGKTIARRWAHRYYDAVTVGAAFVARDVERRLAEAGMPTDAAHNFDGATVVGEFVDVASAPVGTVPYALNLDGQPIATGEGAPMSVDAVIERLSAWCQLRQGDYLFLSAPARDVAVHENQHVAGSLGDRRVLTFNIK